MSVVSRAFHSLDRFLTLTKQATDRVVLTCEWQSDARLPLKDLFKLTDKITLTLAACSTLNCRQ